jgi:hypothetical protein
MSEQWVTITHPVTGGEAEIALSALAAHEQSGWVLVTGETDTGTVEAHIEIEEADDGED